MSILYMIGLAIFSRNVGPTTEQAWILTILLVIDIAITGYIMFPR